jgi:diguanylate cyclase (GGDEF)-like protein
VTLTVGVLSPFVGGDYYGAIIDGAARAVTEAGGRVIAVQTLDPGSPSADQAGVPQLRRPVAWSHVDGFVVLPGAARADYLQCAQAAGKPVVLISHALPGLTCPAVTADNETGMREAVEHLIGHGHRRIAFVGYLQAGDLRERRNTWAATLQEHGLFDPELQFDVDDNHESGGEFGAQRLIRAGLPCTATVCGTDRNAIGLMRTLQAAGYRLPEDQAVIGFDDIDATRYLVPSLSSVRQPLALLGKRGVEVLRARLRDGADPVEGHLTPTDFIPRDSCGCRFSTLPPDPDGHARPATPERLAADLAATAPPGHELSVRETGRLAEVSEALVRVLERAGQGLTVPSEVDLQPMLEDLFAFGGQPQTVGEIVQALRSLVDDLVGQQFPGADATTVRRLERTVQQIALQVGHAQARARFEDISYLQEMLNGQYELGMDLLRSHERDPRRLGWLGGSPLRAGSLGLWFSETDPDDDPDLHLVGAFRRAGPAPSGQPAVPVSTFPPEDLLAVADAAPGEVVFVVPVRSASRDWGVLAAVGTVQARTPPGREVMNQSGALLAVALDQDTMLTSLREQEDRLRRAALYDQLTGLANRSLFLDRLDQATRRARHAPDYRFAVLFLDLDGFKTINDTLGHAAGDQVLAEAAERIRQDIRETDTAARFGGDEFVILLDGFPDPRTPDRVASRLAESLSRPFHPQGHRIAISASIGLARSGDPTASSEELLRDADTAMYRAKSRRADREVRG